MKALKSRFEDFSDSARGYGPIAGVDRTGSAACDVQEVKLDNQDGSFWP